jgi:protein SCO1/2
MTAVRPVSAMKTISLLLFASLFLGGSLLADDPGNPSRASTLRQENPAAGDKPCACDKEESVPAPQKDACCASESAEIENQKSKIESFTKESLYQLDASFTNDAGESFSLGSLRGRPVVLNMFFASCGYACPLTVSDLLAIQGRLAPELRGRAAFVLVSFDVARDTTAALAKYRAQRGLDGQWILLRGDDDSVRELAALLGVKYKQEADGMFSHSNIVTVLNREGEIVHQRTGLKGGLDEAAAALVATTLAQ